MASLLAHSPSSPSPPLPKRSLNAQKKPEDNCHDIKSEEDKSEEEEDIEVTEGEDETPNKSGQSEQSLLTRRRKWRKISGDDVKSPNSNSNSNSNSEDEHSGRNASSPNAPPTFSIPFHPVVEGSAETHDGNNAAMTNNQLSHSAFLSQFPFGPGGPAGLLEGSPSLASLMILSSRYRHMQNNMLINPSNNNPSSNNPSIPKVRSPHHHHQ